jgi:ParB family chromosome partitioning protein
MEIIRKLFKQGVNSMATKEKPKPILIRRNTDHEAMQKALGQTPIAPKAAISAEEVSSAEIKTAETYNVGSVYSLPLSLLQRSTVNARVFYSPEELDEMSKSLKEKGQDIPVIGYMNGLRITLVDGQKRFQAATNASMSSLNVLIVNAPKSETEEYEESRRINITRSSQTALDDAIRWKALIDKGAYETLDELATRLEVSKANVSKTLSINKIPERLLRAMSDHVQTRTLSIAYEVSRIFTHENFTGTAEEGENLAQDVIDEIKKKDLSRNQAQALIDSKLNGPKQRMRAEATLVRYGEAKGTLKVFPSRGQLDLSFRGLSEDKVNELKKKIEDIVLS